MDENMSQETISNSKEESIAKALQLLQGGVSTNTPLQRPNISTVKTLGLFVLWVAIICGLIFLCLYVGPVFNIPTYVLHLVATVGCLLIIAAKAKSFIKSAVLLYQKHAPEEMRRSCLFEPSCSEYMLLAIEKYGVIVGVCKGIHRLSRCHHPNGGVDYP